jgi:putative salt-induced outer membrane protein
MLHSLKRSLGTMALLAATSVSTQLSAQDWDLATELELGAIFTSGNTDDENIRFRGRFDAIREDWSYRFSMDGFRSSSDDELSAQRLYTVGRATYNFDPDNFVQGRVAHEDDRFSGYDSQTEASVSYGQVILRNIDNMSFSYTVGAGVRVSRATEETEDDFEEAILRLSGDYSWDISDSARFIQTLSVDAGERSSIGRSESSIETDIMENLSMKFTINVKHQTEVPAEREKTDTEASITLLLRF